MAPNVQYGYPLLSIILTVFSAQVHACQIKNDCVADESLSWQLTTVYIFCINMSSEKISPLWNDKTIDGFYILLIFFQQELILHCYP